MGLLPRWGQGLAWVCRKTEDGRERVVGTFENVIGQENSAWAEPLSRICAGLGAGEVPSGTTPSSLLPWRGEAVGSVPTGQEDLHQEGGGLPGVGSGLQSILLSAKSYSRVPFPRGCCGLQTEGWLDWPPLWCPGPGDPQRKGMLTSHLWWAGLLVQCRIQGRGP